MPFGADDFPIKKSYSKALKIVHVSALASRSDFGPAISCGVVQSCIVFCSAMSANRIVVKGSVQKLPVCKSSSV